MASEQPSSPEILRRASAGDSEALTRLYDRHADGLYRLAFRLTESSADAQDVVQDVFVGLPEALRTFEGRGSFEGWLKKVVVRTALMKLRQRKRRAEVPLSALGQLLVRSQAPPIVDRLALERAIGVLPEDLRVVVVLKEFEGFSHKEIAETLGITPGASGARMYRAMKILRRTLHNAG